MHWAKQYITLNYDLERFNCWHFFRLVMADEFNIDVPIVDINPLETVAKLRAFVKHGELGNWRVVHEPQEGDAVMMGTGSSRITGEAVSHIGIYIELGAGGVLHCDAKPIGRVVFTRASDLTAAMPMGNRKIIRYLRHKTK